MMLIPVVAIRFVEPLGDGMCHREERLRIFGGVEPFVRGEVAFFAQAVQDVGEAAVDGAVIDEPLDALAVSPSCCSMPSIS